MSDPKVFEAIWERKDAVGWELLETLSNKFSDIGPSLVRISGTLI